MKHLFLIILLPYLMISQNKIINPKGKWYFGAEIGRNKIISFDTEDNQPSNFFQGGILAEYYTGRHWSLSGRIKYFNTGVSFYNPDTHSGSWFDLGSDASFGNFKGEVISVPVTIKWEFRMIKNLRGYLKMGIAYNYETKSEYVFSSNRKTDYPKQFGSFNTGMGLTYFISDKTAVYVENECYLLGGFKGSNDGFIWNKPYNTENSLLNFGVKYNFKNK